MRNIGSLDRRCSGLTLIELLVVLVILVTLGAIVVPNFAPTVEERRTREAARGVSLFIGGARARAIQSGRPVGVQFRRFANESNASLALHYAESSPQYTGDFPSSEAKVRLIKSDPVPSVWELQVQPAQNNDRFNVRLVREGDWIQFGDKGNVFAVDRITSSTNLVATIQMRPGMLLPWNGSYSNTSFRVFRRPVAVTQSTGVATYSQSGLETYQLPSGMAIDLVGSVFPGVTIDHSHPGPVTVMFAPSGQVSDVYVGNGARYYPTGTIHLLVGKREKIPAGGQGDSANWRDLTNLYVSINQQTGQATSAEVAPVAMDADGNPTPSDLTSQLIDATRFARDSRQLGAN